MGTKDDKPQLDRRDFLKTVGVGAAAPGLIAPAAGLITPGVGIGPALRPETRVAHGLAQEIPSLCDLCFWRCGILAKVHDGAVVRVTFDPSFNQASSFDLDCDAFEHDAELKTYRMQDVDDGKRWTFKRMAKVQD